MDHDDIWVPEGAPDEIELDPPTPPTVEPEPEPARQSQRTLKSTEKMQDMFRQQDVAFLVAFEALAEVSLWEFEEEANNPLAFVSKT